MIDAQPVTPSPQTPSLFTSAWARTKDRWKNYLLVVLEFVVLPFVIAGMVTLLSVIFFPFLSSLVKGSNGVPFQIGAAVASILLPVVSLFMAFYRMFIGGIAIIKSVIDPVKDRKKTISESKALLTPYINFITILSILNLGFLIYIPISLGTVLFFMNIWIQFATFSFLLDEKKGAINIWTGVRTYGMNFWYVTGQTILLSLSGIVIGNLGVVIQYAGRRPALSIDVLGAHIISMVATFLFQIFSIAYIYEVYTRIPKPEEVKTPKLWLFLSILGWIIGFGALAAAMQYLLTHPIQLGPNAMPGLKP